MFCQRKYTRSESDAVFKIKSITPIGFKVPDYPQPICLVCRADLLGVCIDCTERKQTICPINKALDENYYHLHCMGLIKKKEGTGVISIPKDRVLDQLASDTESDDGSEEAPRDSRPAPRRPQMVSGAQTRNVSADNSEEEYQRSRMAQRQSVPDTPDGSRSVNSDSESDVTRSYRDDSSEEEVSPKKKPLKGKKAESSPDEEETDDESTESTESTESGEGSTDTPKPSRKQPEPDSESESGSRSESEFDPESDLGPGPQASDYQLFMKARLPQLKSLYPREYPRNRMNRLADEWRANDGPAAVWRKRHGCEAANDVGLDSDSESDEPESIGAKASRALLTVERKNKKSPKMSPESESSSD